MIDKADEEGCHLLQVGPEAARKLTGVPVGDSLELRRSISKMES